MALSLDNPIVTIDIDSAQLLAQGHPVYSLMGFQQDRIVIKQEEMKFRMNKTLNPNPGAKEALRMNVNLMHSVDPEAKVVVLSGAEVQAIREFIEYQQLIANTTQTPLSADLLDLSNNLRMGGKWVKMGLKLLSNLERAGLDRIGGNKTGTRRFAAALNSPGGLEKLGEVIAVDLFNDNQDRFSVQSGGFFNQIPLRFLVNVGNVLMSTTQLNGQVRDNITGLDSWDPNGPNRKTRDRLDNQQRHLWGGPLLGPTGTVNVNGNVITKDAFAEGVIADLEFVLGPRDRKFFLLRNQRLGFDAKRRLKHGMKSGVRKIRDHLRGQGGVNALPVLVQDKVNALGWNPL